MERVKTNISSVSRERRIFTWNNFESFRISLLRPLRVVGGNDNFGRHINFAGGQSHESILQECLFPRFETLCEKPWHTSDDRKISFHWLNVLWGLADRNELVYAISIVSLNTRILRLTGSGSMKEDNSSYLRIRPR